MLLLVGCDRFDAWRGKSDAKTDGVPSLAADCGEVDCTSLAFVRSVSSIPLFELFASDDQPLGAFTRSLKFFVDGRDPALPAMYYMNANFKIDGAVPESAKLHYAFARSYLHIPEPASEYDFATYFTNDKRYFAGSVQRYHLADEGIDVYGVQFFPQDVISGATIVTALKLVSSSFKIPSTNIAFVRSGEQQTVTGFEAEVQAMGIRILTIDQVLGSLDYLALNAGQAVGHLRLFPTNQDDLRPTDIPVFDELPLSLAVVAGVITKSYQDPNSHVNLKSHERGTPNMVLRSVAADNPTLAAFKDQPVRLVVEAGSYRIEAATEEEVQASLAERLARPWIPMPIDVEDRLLSYDEMCPSAPEDCLTLKRRYGSKAANLGFLANPYVLGRVNEAGALSAQIGYDLSPHGLGVPYSFYQTFVAHPANAAIRDSIAALIAAERSGDVSPADRRNLAQTIRLAFLAGAMPAGLATALRERVAAVIPDASKIKIRSSANAEDVAGFNGAGLYDSFKAKPSLPDEPSVGCVVQNIMNKHGTVRAKVLPDTIECAMRATWASLWNERAISERTWARLEHADAVMGLAIVPSYDLGSDIAANAVLVTRATGADDTAGYALSSQVKNNLVTNPGSGSWSELAIAVLLTDEMPTSLTILRHAKPEAAADLMTTNVFSNENMLLTVEVAKTVERAWCRSDPSYYPLGGDGRDCRWSVFDGTKTRALDFEIKLRGDGQLVFKQVRPFANHP